ncbi:hypothetical protein PMAYCL1PPCAC_05534, partial [Pristionchus mayeri]
HVTKPETMQDFEWLCFNVLHEIAKDITDDVSYKLIACIKNILQRRTEWRELEEALVKWTASDCQRLRL